MEEAATLATAAWTRPTRKRVRPLILSTPQASPPPVLSSTYCLLLRILRALTGGRADFSMVFDAVAELGCYNIRTLDFATHASYLSVTIETLISINFFRHSFRGR